MGVVRGALRPTVGLAGPAVMGTQRPWQGAVGAVGPTLRGPTAQSTNSASPGVPQLLAHWAAWSPRGEGPFGVLAAAGKGQAARQAQ